MKAQDLAASFLDRSLKMLQNTLADFSDGDMLVRPCPGANHAAWQMGHLIAVQARLSVGMGAGDIHPMVPANFAGKYTKETAKLDEASVFDNKETLIEMFSAESAATARFLRALPDEVLSNPMPEQIRARLPDVGHAMLLLSSHTTLHTGQFQVIRRKLGKPLLF